jgi:hypothetical protein
MATTYEVLEGYLEQDEVIYKRLEHCLEVVFPTHQFVNQHNGRDTLHVLIAVSEGGESVDFCAPRLYDLRTAASPTAVCEMLASVNFQTRTFCWEVDRRDGEVRGTISTRLAGGLLTHEAFRRLLSLIPRTVDFWHPVIQRVFTTGTLPPAPTTATDPRLEQAFDDAGGLEGLREIFKRLGSDGE